VLPNFCSVGVLPRFAGDHPHQKTISLLAISVSPLEEHWDVELELPLGLGDEGRRPGTKRGMARWAADHAVDNIRGHFEWDAIGYGSIAEHTLRVGRGQKIASDRAMGVLQLAR
jgi:hypothetical protein